MNKYSELLERIARLEREFDQIPLVSDASSTVFAYKLEVGGGNNITPTGSPISFYGCKGSQGHAAITELPSVNPVQQDDGYDDCLAWATFKTTQVVWVSTRMVVGTTELIGWDGSVPATWRSALSYGWYLMPVVGGGTARVYLINEI